MVDVDESIMPSLRDLGLSSYEADAYEALVGIGPADAETIATRSGVPMGRIYDVLGDLDTRNVVHTQKSGRPRKYVAVEPTLAVDRLLEAELEDIERTRTRLESVAEELKDDLDSGTDSQERFWTAAVGSEAAVDLLLERIDTAEDRVITVIDTISESLDIGDVGARTLAHLGGAIEDNVAVSLLLDAGIVAEAPTDLKETVAMPPFDDPTFEVRMLEEVYSSYAIIDGEETCLFFSNPTDNRSLLAMINLRDPVIAAEIEASFESMWASGVAFKPEDALASDDALGSRDVLE